MATEKVAIDYLEPEKQKAIRAAEKSDGFAYGAQFLPHPDGRYEPVFVTVRFYPKRRWILVHEDDTEVPLTKDLFQRLERMKL